MKLFSIENDFFSDGTKNIHYKLQYSNLFYWSNLLVIYK